MIALAGEYGMLSVLLLLCVFFSAVTITDQQQSGEAAAASLYRRIQSELPASANVVIVARPTVEDSLFAHTVRRLLVNGGYATPVTVFGAPQLVRESLLVIAESQSSVGAIVGSAQMSAMIAGIAVQIPALQTVPVLSPPLTRWPTFLLPDNVRNIANQIAVIAIIAIGMTMVIIAGGIDLSVGSLIAFSAVLTAWIIGIFGGAGASAAGMISASLAAIMICGVTGLFSGVMITTFRIPPFIATLAIMQVAAGLAYIISKGMPIYEIPDGFVWLGRGAEPILRIPIAVLVMVGFYIVAHLVMTRTTFGRYVYAVGGNSEAARLAGIRVHLISRSVYTVSAGLAGIGGVMMASQLKSGAPTYGAGYELNVIAAVVVGGTSLSGGEGRVFGTLIGALVIGVIQNGMNLTNVESYTQKVVLGLVILGAVLLDQLKHRGFTRFLRRQISR